MQIFNNLKKFNVMKNSMVIYTNCTCFCGSNPITKDGNLLTANSLLRWIKDYPSELFVTLWENKTRVQMKYNTRTYALPEKCLKDFAVFSEWIKGKIYKQDQDGMKQSLANMRKLGFIE